MSLPRYPEYKDSGVAWLGEIPFHWGVDRIKASIASSKNGIWGDEPKGDETDILCVRVADFDRHKILVNEEIPTVRSITEKERSGRLLNRGNLLLEKSGGGELQPVGQVVLFQHDIPAVCSNFVAKLVLADEMVPGFWNYVHSAAYAVRLNVGSINQTSGIQNLDQASYFTERAPYPPIQEQTTIASFLDRETAKIDTLIAEQERLIELLAEKRQATISRAVTKGLNPDAPMKDSGVEWLGEIPEHWTVKKLKHIGVAKIGLTYDPSEVTSNGDGVLVLRSSNVQDGQIKFEDNVFVNTVIPEILRTKVDDILICSRNGSRNLIGKNALITDSAAGLTFGAFMTVFRSPQNKYLFWVFNSQLFTFQSGTFLTSTINQLTTGNLYSFEIPLPPESEQRIIEDFLSRETKKIDELVFESNKVVSMLKERRSALISAAVTGKIDVRNLVEKEAA